MRQEFADDAPPATRGSGGGSKRIWDEEGCGWIADGDSKSWRDDISVLVYAGLCHIASSYCM
jgi:hypothetical protein